jgi:protein-L-isoaspartate(D-aspartate) O-methyltransferase
MVETQLVPRGIGDSRVLDAMREVPRHRFVDPGHARDAYADHPIPIGFGQTISQPYIVAYMVEQLHLGPASRVLEIGTGCGYQTAVLARVAGEVYSVEILDQLANQARARLAELGVTGVVIETRDGHAGWPEHSPYDGIIVAAAAPKVPPALVEQIALGGRLIIPLGTDWQTLHLITRTASGTTDEQVMDVRFVPLTRG